jgi:Xaa-Pro aminopeptidase
VEKSIFKTRREKLLEQIKKSTEKTGSIFLWANGVAGNQRFEQEASFYYFTGINEPSVVMQLDFDGTTRLFIPDTRGQRAQWLPDTCDTSLESARRLGVDEIVYLGEPVSGYQLSPLFSEREVSRLIQELRQSLAAHGAIFTCVPQHGFDYAQQNFYLTRLAQYIPQLIPAVHDISANVATLRRTKDMAEIECIFRAVQATMAMHSEITVGIVAGTQERMLQAHLAAMTCAFGTQPAFEPIVATGKSSVFPHYDGSGATLCAGDMVIIDCGAQYEHYCADITRTYPVGGTFTKRQQELYDIVVNCQIHLESLVKPGMYLNNKNMPEKSLYHHARSFFERHGCHEYMVHGIGHFLGLQVHDVGAVDEPLRESDVFALEPALYLPHEGFGIRVEDNYWLLNDACHCFSQELVKTSSDIQRVLQHRTHKHDSSCKCGH